MNVDSQAMLKFTNAVSSAFGEGSNRQDYLTGVVTKNDADGVVWVAVDGGVSAMPVERTTATYNPGDRVSFTIENGVATIAGNITSPATDDATADKAYSLAESAARAAESAEESAEKAYLAAEDATADAARAASAADTASDMAEQAIADAGVAAEAATAASSDANEAAESALVASESASTASAAANNALSGLHDLQNVVGTVNWIANNHAHYALTEDTEVQEGKVYYVVDPDAPNGYSQVDTPVDTDLASYYELSVTESVQDYLSAHLALIQEGEDPGLELFALDGGYKARLTMTGLKIFDPDGNEVGLHGTEVRLGLETGLHLLLTAGLLSFMAGDQIMGYFGNDAAQGEEPFWRMFIPNARITDELQFGNYVWKPRNSGNNITLTYVGG